MTVNYKIIRSKRKTIGIQIKPDGSVVVRCPISMKNKDIQAFVNSKNDWIITHLSKIKAVDSAPFTDHEIERLRSMTAKLVQERVAHYSRQMGVSCNRITIRMQRTRWGSCSGKGNLNFNCLLALVPADVLDYVVVHELSHLKEMNHSHKFWDEVRKVLPDYEKSRRWLRENGNMLISRIPMRK